MCLFIQSKVVGVVLSESTLMIHVSSGLCSSALLLVSSVFRASRNWLAGMEGRKTKERGRRTDGGYGVYTSPGAQSGTKECPTAENSNVLNRNFDLPVIDLIRQLENPHYSYTCRSCTLTCM